MRRGGSACFCSDSTPFCFSPFPLPPSPPTPINPYQTTPPIAWQTPLPILVYSHFPLTRVDIDKEQKSCLPFLTVKFHHFPPPSLSPTIFIFTFFGLFPSFFPSFRSFSCVIKGVLGGSFGSLEPIREKQEREDVNGINPGRSWLTLLLNESNSARQYIPTPP